MGHSPRDVATTVAAALEEHETALRAYVSRRVAQSDVDDVVQAAALRALERASSLRDPLRVRGWLYQIHRNVIADHFRGQREVATEFEEVALDDRSLGGCRCVLTQLDQVPANYAAVLKLVHSEEKTVDEAAETLGISPNNASVRLHRGRNALRRQLREHCGVTSIRECNGCKCADDGCCAA